MVDGVGRLDALQIADGTALFGHAQGFGKECAVGLLYGHVVHFLVVAGPVVAQFELVQHSFWIHETIALPTGIAQIGTAEVQLGSGHRLVQSMRTVRHERIDGL